MRRKTHILALIILCGAIEIMLILVVPLLESFTHPLVSSLTCIETEEKSDLYWNINQIDVTGSIGEEENMLSITVQHNIPDFDSYFFRMDADENWHQTSGNDITVKLTGSEHLFEVKAKNKMGVMLPKVSYTILREDDRVRVLPDEQKIVKGKYAFRFENTRSPKVTWLQQYTLPVIAPSAGQWDQYQRIRKWVREQIPNSDPRMESQWDAQRILQAVWKDATAGFICDAFAATYVSACISTGLQARMLHLADEDGRGHYATEIWSDDYSKWIFMDPLYGCYFTADAVPLSALELHDRWKNSTWKGVEKQGEIADSLRFDASPSGYFSLFKDIQFVNANDFLSSPFTSVLDLLTGNLRYIRWVDASNPPYNRLKLGFRVLMFYYLPKVLRGFVIPLFIPACMLLLGSMLVKKGTIHTADKKYILSLHDNLDTGWKVPPVRHPIVYTDTSSHYEKQYIHTFRNAFAKTCPVDTLLHFSPCAYPAVLGDYLRSSRN